MALEAFKRQGYAVEKSRAADADAVLIAGNGARIGMLCKKYRSAFIGRPVIQQFSEAMLKLSCTEGYLIATTDCSPEAHVFATGKGIVLYNRERTTELLRTAFGDEIFRSGKVPAPPAAGTAIGAATARKQAPVSAEPSDSLQATDPERPSPIDTAEAKQSGEEQAGQSAAPSGTPEPVPSDKMTTIVCWECNKQLVVPYDQGVIMVTCPECGMKRLYQPPVNSDGELQTTTIITCRSCKQNLNVPINRGQLKVRCPNCKKAWVFTP